MDLEAASPALRIADWEFSRGSGTLGFADDPMQGTPPGARVLLDALAPYLAPVTEALAPLLSARGLSPAHATLEEVLAIEGFADELLEAASAAMARADFFEFVPVSRETLVESTFVAPEVGLPDGWDLHVERGPRHLKLDENGDPCYPDVPAFEEYWPKCPVPDPPEAPVDVPCDEDSRFLHADARLRTLRNFERLPEDFRGYNYREKLEESVAVSADVLYRCSEHPSSPSTMASWYGPPGPGVIRLYERFLDLETEWDLLGVLTGPVNFRAGILLHEHVHRIEDPQTGTVSAPPDRDYHPAGSSGQDACPWSGTEYDAAYLQALYLGASEPIARLVADLYGRKQCDQISCSAKLLAAAGDIVEALALGWVASLEVLATFATRLDSDNAIALLLELFPTSLAALVLLGLLF